MPFCKVYVLRLSSGKVPFGKKLSFGHKNLGFRQIPLYIDDFEVMIYSVILLRHQAFPQQQLLQTHKVGLLLTQVPF